MLRSKSTKSTRKSTRTRKTPSATKPNLLSKICAGIVIGYLLFLIGYIIGSIAKAIWMAFKNRTRKTNAKRNRRAKTPIATTCTSMVHVPSFSTSLNIIPLTPDQSQAAAIAAASAEIATATVTKGKGLSLPNLIKAFDEAANSPEAIDADWTPVQ